MKSIILLTIFHIGTVFALDNYCVGVRGNGELVPAHWSGMSRIVENRGFPTTVAGGSSAAITIFFLDALSRNHMYSEQGDIKKLEQALLLKSLVPHITYLLREDVKVPTMMRLVSNIMNIKEGGFVSALKKAVTIAKDFKTFMQVLGEYGRLLNPDIVIGLRENFSFYKGQVAEGIKVFGSFDAQNDMAILYRKGLVDFKQLAIILGRIADYYAGYSDSKVNTKLSHFMSVCATPAKNKLWKDLVKANPECQELFEDSLSEYYSNKTIQVKDHRLGGKVSYLRKKTIKRTFPDKMVFEKIGSGLNAYPTTALLIGDAVERYKEYTKTYEQSHAKDYEQFSLNFNTEISYGYWGSDKGLQNLSNKLPTLFKGDLKSSKFKPLSGGIWFEVLGTSPAEPGLSQILKIPDGNLISRQNVINKKYFYKSFFGILPSLKAIPWFNENNPTKGVIPFRSDILSAGGWSDLHPTLVLKASGCEDTVYLTRQGGESVFGQQIFIRLTGYTDTIPFWTEIREHNRDGWTNLSPEVEASPWNKLYNLMNPTSSFNKSIKTASAVYCTNWDKYYVFKGEVDQVVEDAYYAPIFVNDEDYRHLYDFGGDPTHQSEDGFPGCILKNF